MDTYKVYGKKVVSVVVEVKADSYEEAIQKANSGDTIGSPYEEYSDNPIYDHAEEY